MLLINIYLITLPEEISGLLTNESLYRQRIEELSTDLQGEPGARHP